MADPISPIEGILHLFQNAAQTKDDRCKGVMLLDAPDA
ncbi:MAG: hypothetical protein JWQ87_1434 [Candidatus Sulfotelmatobacter sp.]|nr:hypothetical protein [Candidatus Sulfotelmatobacter sp.]